MAQGKRHEQRNRCTGRRFAFLLLVALPACASAAWATYTLPADRFVPWQGNVGVRGDIPPRTTIYKTLSPSGGNDSAAINAAIAACPAGQVVMLGPGKFLINDHINVKSHITLRGSGMGITTLQGQAGITGDYIVGIDGGPWFDPSHGIARGFTKGSTAITTSAATGYKVGDIVLIDQLNDPSGTYGPVVTNVGTSGAETWVSRGGGARVAGQVNRIAAISGTTVRLEIPLYFAFNSALAPQLTKIDGIVASAGIENLTVNNQTSQTDPAMEIYGASNCWLLGVEVNGSWQNALVFQKSYRNTIRSCKFHEGVPALPATGSQYHTSRAYGVYMNTASANLIENNQFYHLCMTTKMDGPTSGNVVAYNYITAMYFSPNMTWQSDMFSSHGGHTRANLFEGNLGVSSFIADNIWGSHSHDVLFRNRITLDRTRPQRAFDIGLYSMSANYSIIGNVLGDAGFETEYSTAPSSINTLAIYALHPAISASTLIHANWDSVTKGVTWNGTDDHVLPSSLYLSSKPSWWGSLPWPAIGPDVSPMYPASPVVGKGTPWGITKPAPAPTTSVKALK